MKYLQESPSRRHSKTVFALAPRVPITTRRASNSGRGASEFDAASPPDWRWAGGFISNGLTRALCRCILLVAIWLFGCSAVVVSAQTIQCQSSVFTNNSPCNPGRCLLTRWKATVPLLQTLTYAVELSTNCLSWQEAATPITLTQSANIEVWITVDGPVGFVRLRIVQ
jgi:hypothetical protein